MLFTLCKTRQKKEILPIFHPNSGEYIFIFGDLIGTGYEGKAPDFRVDGKYYELEGFVWEGGGTRWASCYQGCRTSLRTNFKG